MQGVGPQEDTKLTQVLPVMVSQQIFTALQKHCSYPFGQAVYAHKAAHCI